MLFSNITISFFFLKDTLHFVISRHFTNFLLYQLKHHFQSVSRIHLHPFLLPSWPRRIYLFTMVGLINVWLFIILPYPCSIYTNSWGGLLANSLNLSGCQYVRWVFNFLSRLSSYVPGLWYSQHLSVEAPLSNIHCHIGRDTWHRNNDYRTSN